MTWWRDPGARTTALPIVPVAPMTTIFMPVVYLPVGDRQGDLQVLLMS